MMVFLLWLIESASASLVVPEILTHPANSTLSESTKNTIVESTVPKISFENYTGPCTDYFQSSLSSNTDGGTHSQCTESGAVLDQLIIFIKSQFDQHTCGHLMSSANHKEILYCSILQTHMTCSVSDAEGISNINTGVLPTYTEVGRAVEVLCLANQTLARACLLKSFGNIKKCIKRDVLSIMKLRNEKWTYGALDECRHFEVRIMCVWEELETCGEKTAKTMAGLVGSVLKPQACSLSGALRIYCFQFLYVSAFITTLSLTTFIL